jgi:hypothetical protein
MPALPNLHNTANTLRQLHGLPTHENEIATIARGLVDKYGSGVLDAQKLAAGDATEQAAVRALLAVEGGPIFVKTTAGLNVQYATLALAKAAALAGQSIYVGPGSYTITASLAKNGVNWDFALGATVSRTDNTAEAIWDDGNTAMTFTVTGEGDFSRSTSNATNADIIRLRHASSDIAIYGRDFTGAAPGNAESSVLRQEAGRVVVEGRFANCTATAAGLPTAYAFWWLNGEGYVRFRKITSDYASVFGGVSATPTGEFHAYAEEFVGAVGFYALQATATMWIQGNILREVPASNPTISAVTCGGTGKIYVTVQKAYGMVQASAFDGLVYFNADKHEATRNFSETSSGTLIDWGTDGGSTGTLFYDCPHLDPKTFTGPSFNIGSGVVNIIQASLTGAATTSGVAQAGGTIRISGLVRLDTVANSATSPITKSGGSLIIGAGAVLKAHASATSISAPTAQNVVNYGYWTNKAKDADVTLLVVSTENVSADVV